MPCMSEGNAPCAGVHPASRCRSRAEAARAHWNLRWAVGTTTISRPGDWARDRRAAARARVVLPAPGVATARKSDWVDRSSWSSAASCQGRSRMDRAISDCGYDGGGRTRGRAFLASMVWGWRAWWGSRSGGTVRPSPWRGDRTDRVRPVGGTEAPPGPVVDDGGDQAGLRGPESVGHSPSRPPPGLRVRIRTPPAAATRGPGHVVSEFRLEP